jgi:hypothetical protein
VLIATTIRRLCDWGTDIHTAQAWAEDVIQNCAVNLLRNRYDVANVEEAIAEAMRDAITEVMGEISKLRKHESSLVKKSKTDDDEYSQLDMLRFSLSVEEEILAIEDELCSLEEKIEHAESVRYKYGFDALMAVLLFAGAEKKLWKKEIATGLLAAFGYQGAQKYIKCVRYERVAEAALNTEETEFISVVRRNLPLSNMILTALGCGV